MPIFIVLFYAYYILTSMDLLLRRLLLCVSVALVPLLLCSVFIIIVAQYGICCWLLDSHLKLVPYFCAHVFLSQFRAHHLSIEWKFIYAFTSLACVIYVHIFYGVCVCIEHGRYENLKWNCYRQKTTIDKNYKMCITHQFQMLSLVLIVKLYTMHIKLKNYNLWIKI